MLGVAGLLQFGRAVAVISLINSVKFQQRVAFAVKRSRGVGEIARQMTAQLAALLFDRLGLRDFLDQLNHAVALRRQAENAAPRRGSDIHTCSECQFCSITHVLFAILAPALGRYRRPDRARLRDRPKSAPAGRRCRARRVPPASIANGSSSPGASRYSW